MYCNFYDQHWLNILIKKFSLFPTKVDASLREKGLMCILLNLMCVHQIIHKDKKWLLGQAWIM